MLEHQLGLFRDLMRFVWRRSPFYRELYSDHGIRESDLDGVLPTDLPTVDKRALMDGFDQAVTDPAVRFRDMVDCWSDPGVADKASLRPYALISTSGTMGKPALLIYDHAGWEWIRAAFLVRLIHRRGRRKWVHRRAFLGGNFHMGAGALMTRTRPRLAPEPLIVSPQDPMEGIVRRLNAYRPTLLTGFSSPVAALAREAIQGRLRIDPEVVGTSGETLTPGMEDDIEKAWPGRQVNAYSASEALCVAARRYRQPFTVYDDLFVVEVLNDQGVPVPTGDTGEVVITHLHNHVLPLIRYRMSDLATLGNGRSEGPFSVIETLVGREDEAVPIIRDDGTPGEIRSVEFSGFISPALLQFKVLLTAPDLIEAPYVAREDIDDQVREWVLTALRVARAGNRMRVEARRVSSLAVDPRTNKVRFTEVLCDVGGRRA